MKTRRSCCAIACVVSRSSKNQISASFRQDRIFCARDRKFSQVAHLIVTVWIDLDDVSTSGYRNVSTVTDAAYDCHHGALPCVHDVCTVRSSCRYTDPSSSNEELDGASRQQQPVPGSRPFEPSSTTLSQQICEPQPFGVSDDEPFRFLTIDYGGRPILALANHPCPTV
jgi:hypothetical protein